MSKDIESSDDELEALMAELEAQNAEITAMQAAKSTPVEEVASAVPADEAPPAVEEKPTVMAETIAPEASVVEDVTDEVEVQAAVAEVPSVVEKAEVPAAAVVALERNGTDLTDVEPKANPKRPTVEKSATGLDHCVDVDQFRSDTKLTEATLDACMIEQSGLRAYYGAVAARAEAQAARVKAKFEVAEATLYDHHRKELAASGEKTTEKMVENAVKLDPRWIKAKNMVIEADTIASINKSLVESLKDRRDMIIQLGADRRDEYKGAARVLAEQSERDELRDRAMRVAQGIGKAA